MTLIYVPAIYILNGILGVNGLVWAQPIADVLSIGLSVVLYMIVFKRVKSDSPLTGNH